MNKKIVMVLGLLMVLVFSLTACSIEPELVVSNSYKHRGDYYGDYSVNTYTFEIKNNSISKDITSVEYFTIDFYDGRGNYIGCWDADRSDLNQLALESGEKWQVQIDVEESILPYSGDWDYEISYTLYYND